MRKRQSIQLEQGTLQVGTSYRIHLRPTGASLRGIVMGEVLALSRTGQSFTFGLLRGKQLQIGYAQVRSLISISGCTQQVPAPWLDAGDFAD